MTENKWGIEISQPSESVKPLNNLRDFH